MSKKKSWEDKRGEEENYKKFIELLKERGKWEECSMICYPKIQSKVIKRELDLDLIEKVKRRRIREYI
jgi:ADP-heptose:LPS heptosyltransferase